MKRPLIFAHRGAKGTHPENTMLAFYEAEQLGADGLELDVHLSKDGEAVVIHDETVDRTTNGSGFVGDFTLSELQQLDAGSWFHPSFADARIPSLREVLAWAAGTRLQVNIELKNDCIEYPLLEEKAAALVVEYGLTERVIFSSFRHESVARLARLAPQIKRAILYHEPLADPLAEGARYGADLHPNFQLLTKEFIAAAQAAGFAVRPYTINQYSDLERLMDWGADVIMTDWPARALGLLGEKNLL